MPESAQLLVRRPRAPPSQPEMLVGRKVSAGGPLFCEAVPQPSFFRVEADYLAIRSLAETGESAAPNPELTLSLGEVAEKDFQQRKALSYALGRSNPPIRLAAFLVTLSRNNAREGRDPKVIPDTLNCGVVAEMLGLEVSALAAALLELANKHLIELVPEASLRISDIKALERFADGKDCDSSPRTLRIDRNPVGTTASPTVQHPKRPPSTASLWKTLWSESREVLWLLAIVTSLSIASVGLAALLVALLPSH